MEGIGNGALKMERISIAFPGVQALSEVNFEAGSGRVHALIGANGAGKSTLMKILAGAYNHYTGEIKVDGQEVKIHNPKDAKDQGIQVVFQEVDTALIPYLTVGENIMMEQVVHGMKRKYWIGWKKLHRSAQQALERIQAKIPTDKLVRDLTLAEKQMVLIARSVATKCRYLILDEPTAPLSSNETEQLFRLIRRLKSEGVGIIFISHRLPELFEICDDITVMRDGRVVFAGEISSIDQQGVVEHMLGMKLDNQFPKKERTIGKVSFEVKAVSDGDKVRSADLYIREGEIVGLAGLVGAGKTELCRVLFGASRLSSGDIQLRGKKLLLRSPHDAVKGGIILVPEERRREGIFVQESVSVNLTVASLNRFLTWGPWVSRAKEKQASQDMIRSLGIKTPSDQTRLANLSGGNQQKVAIGKWLLVDADVYIFDEPTKGVDVGAKRDIYELIAELAARGKSILYASSEMSEMMGITDRIYVMYDGKVLKELETARTNEEEIMLYSIGGVSR